MTKNYISMTLFVNQNKKTLYFTAFNTVVETFLTYSLGEHDPKSVQAGRTSSEM